MNWWKRNSNSVLTVVEIFGFIGTVVTTVRATSKIQQKPEYYRFKSNKTLEKEELAQGVYTEYLRDKTKKEKTVDFFRAMFPECITPLIFGSITIGAMIGCKHQYMSQQAALASSYTVLKRMYDENRDKVQEIMDEISPLDHNNPTALDNIEESMNGEAGKRNDIFFLEYSGRRFKSSLSDVEEALELFDEQFQKSGCASFNDLYLYLGIAETKLGVDNGFADSGRMNNPALPEDKWEHIEWSIRKVTEATGINDKESKKLEDSGKFIYMISIDNNLTSVSFYQDMSNWEIANGLHESL